VAIAICVSGCQSARAPHPAEQRTVTVNGASPGPDASARTDQIEQALGANPADVRLQDISGAILEYYAIHDRLPASLADLQSLPDLDRPLNLVSPASGKPYVYVPEGLKSPRDPRQIVVYDAAPDSAGMRYVILLRRPHGRQTAATWVDRLPDAVFHQYIR
jgi:hypothetical protein